MTIKKFAELKEKDKLYLEVSPHTWEVAKGDKERRKAYGEFLKDKDSHSNG